MCSISSADLVFHALQLIVYFFLKSSIGAGLPENTRARQPKAGFEPATFVQNNAALCHFRKYVGILEYPCGDSWQGFQVILMDLEFRSSI